MIKTNQEIKLRSGVVSKPTALPWGIMGKSTIFYSFKQIHLMKKLNRE
jgi:hypothetical protein